MYNQYASHLKFQERKKYYEERYAKDNFPILPSPGYKSTIICAANLKPRFY